MDSTETPLSPHQTVLEEAPNFSITSNLPRDSVTFEQTGAQADHASSIGGGRDENPYIPEDYAEDASHSSTGETSDGHSLDLDDPYKSDDSAMARQKRWRRNLRQQNPSSTSRQQRKVAGTAHGHERLASSLPDLGLYKTWDSRAALKEMKELKKSLAAAKDKGKTPRKEKVKDLPRRLPDLEGILSRAIEEYTGYDLLDDSPQSLFYGHLLDTIARLGAEINYLRWKSNKPLPNCPQCAEQTVPVPEEPTTRFQVLHRVFCAKDSRFHNHAVYEDEPTRRSDPRYLGACDIELKGDNLITDLEQYCSEHSEISFILFKEHTCVTWNKQSHTYHYVTPIESERQRHLEISSRKERLLIVSEVLLKAFDQVAKCSHKEEGSRDAMQMTAPYLFLYHHRQLLLEYASTMGGETEVHVSLLLGFINEHYKEEYEEADRQFSSGIATKEHIEKLYCPNSIVVVKTEPKDRAYIVKSWLEVKDGNLELPCWSWDYDGSFLRRADKTLRLIVPSALGSSLSTIGVYPISMIDEVSLNDLRERGRKYWSMKEQYFACYSGNDVDRVRFHHKTRFMIDTATYFRMRHQESPLNPSGMVPQHDPWAPSIAREALPSNIVPQFDPWPPFIAREATPDDMMLIVLPPTLYGFDLHTKNWVELYIEHIHPIQWNKKAFDQLVLEERTKKLVKALIEVRISAERMEDVIEGKGNGLIMLLHGSPGTGKTLTAESVAEIAEKPLYRVTCGDLGTKAKDVEMYMDTVLDLGKIWGCVLLLDEADVFLEERTTGYGDLERNNLVSVFLRILEYYDGILILTSNRVGIFDEAFKSRIQVSLHYEDHTAFARKAIWKNFLDILETSGANANIGELEDHLEELSQEVLNGRQIRNAMTTARQLAVHQRQRMDWSHLELALSTANEFDRYLKKVQGGHSDKQWARDNRWR